MKSEKFLCKFACWSFNCNLVLLPTALFFHIYVNLTITVVNGNSLLNQTVVIEDASNCILFAEICV